MSLRLLEQKPKRSTTDSARPHGTVGPHHSYSAPTPAEAPPVASMAPFPFNCL